VSYGIISRHIKGENVMAKRQWTPEEKTKIVLEGLSGKPITQICNDHKISPSLYYLWKDQFLQNSHKAFEYRQINSREERLRKQNQKLKETIGELTLELKKTIEIFEKEKERIQIASRPGNSPLTR
jgi:transposase-like protein